MHVGDPLLLREARKAAGFRSAAAAARAKGWGESAYRHHENGTRPFGIKQAMIYGDAFDITPAHLFPRRYTDEDDGVRELLRDYITPSRREQEIIDAAQLLVDALSLHFVTEVYLDIPVVPGALVLERKFHAFQVELLEQIFSSFSPSDIAAFRMDDPSMGSTAPVGSLLLIDTREKLVSKPEDVWLLRIDDHLLVRRIRKLDGDRLSLTSDGRAGRALELPLDHVKVEGRVKWIGKPIV